MTEAIMYQMRCNISGEPKWETCTREQYADMRRLIEDGSPNVRGFEVRALGVIQDDGGLLIPGPDGFDNWRDAALAERMRRVDAELNLKALIEQPCVDLYRYRFHNDPQTSALAGWDNWQWISKEKFDEINYYIKHLNSRYESEHIRGTVITRNTFNMDLPCPLPPELRPAD